MVVNGGMRRFPRRRCHPLAAACAVACTAAAHLTCAATTTGRHDDREPPIGVRNAHAIAYDGTANRVLLFGGADASRVLGGTYAWDPDRRRWTAVTEVGPAPRTFPVMAFDEAHGEVVLFGGNRVLFGAAEEWNTLLDDTWVLRGSRWEQRQVRGPGPRAEAAMAYDRRRERIVLFGGYLRTPDGRTRLGDTWEWDGERWEQVASSGPQPRNGSALAFDERTGTMVLSGGPPAFVPPETWEWDGRTWRVAAPPHPSPRFNPVVTYHAGLGGLLRFGGWTGTERAADTWIRTAAGWRAIDRAGPSARNHSAIAYDARRGRAVLFGGHDGELVFGDTWEFDGRDWRRVAATAPERRVENHH